MVITNMNETNQSQVRLQKGHNELALNPGTQQNGTSRVNGLQGIPTS